MPNWCENQVSFSGNDEDLEKLMKMIGTAEAPILFEKVLPIPDCLKNNLDRLNWTRAHWGCKWEASNCYDNGDWVLSFDTPWGPPEGIHRAINQIIEEHDLDINISWFYHEPGCLIAGYL